ncbi:GNAT family N-acetyltransferase [Thermobrachium celere]|uniref:Acetyltransferase, GNAT family n=1 Tax=Thermobrachium celere DSM 8682 TaxID=941824 RepID=R7RM06_9CLOT|nr:GNAT family N-acetyltransferase [Thermobrachium celere]GFR34451.1 acetyltransferase [Thermobrachium celere]CDF57202.1 acetyltransferase, GNAT family [Thermobrachium celere DSM 8682]
MMIYELKNGKRLSIRRAQERDAKELVEMYNKLGMESDNLTFGVDDYYLNVDQEKNLIYNLNNRDNCIYLVALIDGKIVGNLTFIASQRKRLMHRGEMGIAVLKDYWNLGIGNSLMDYFFKWVQSTEKIKKVELQVREDNIAAINLYLKWGFKFEGKISKGIMVNGKYYDLYYMGRTIGW